MGLLELLQMVITRAGKILILTKVSIPHTSDIFDTSDTFETSKFSVPMISTILMVCFNNSCKRFRIGIHMRSIVLAV